MGLSQVVPPSPPSGVSSHARLSGSNLILGVSNCRAVGDVCRQVAEAAELGVQTAFIADDIGCRDAFQLVSAAGQVAHETRFGVAVTNPYLRSPEAIVDAVDSVMAALPDSRFALGLGSSSPAVIRGQLGLEYGDPVDVMRLTIRRVRSGLEGRDLGGRTSIVVAAMGPRMLRLAGESADGVLLNTGTTPGYARWARERIAEGTRRSGRPPPMTVWVPAYLGDQREALVRARRWAASMLSIPRQGELLLEHAGFSRSLLGPLRRVYQAYPHGGDVEAGADLIPAEVARTLAVVGDLEDLVTRLEQFMAAGVTRFVLAAGPIRALAGRFEREVS